MQKIKRITREIEAKLSGEDKDAKKRNRKRRKAIDERTPIVPSARREVFSPDMTPVPGAPHTLAVAREAQPLSGVMLGETGPLNLLNRMLVESREAKLRFYAAHFAQCLEELAVYAPDDLYAPLLNCLRRLPLDGLNEPLVWREKVIPPLRTELNRLPDSVREQLALMFPNFTKERDNHDE